jgi:hypothetical protein
MPVELAPFRKLTETVIGSLLNVEPSVGDMILIAPDGGGVGGVGGGGVGGPLPPPHAVRRRQPIEEAKEKPRALTCYSQREN